MYIKVLLCTTAIDWKLKRACKTCTFILLDPMIFQIKIYLTSALTVFFASAFQPDPFLTTTCLDSLFLSYPQKKRKIFTYHNFYPGYIYIFFFSVLLLYFSIEEILMFVYGEEVYYPLDMLFLFGLVCFSSNTIS